MRARPDAQRGGTTAGPGGAVRNRALPPRGKHAKSLSPPQADRPADATARSTDPDPGLQVSFPEGLANEADQGTSGLAGWPRYAMSPALPEGTTVPAPSPQDRPATRDEAPTAPALDAIQTLAAASVPTPPTLSPSPVVAPVDADRRDAAQGGAAGTGAAADAAGEAPAEAAPDAGAGPAATIAARIDETVPAASVAAGPDGAEAAPPSSAVPEPQVAPVAVPPAVHGAIPMPVLVVHGGDGGRLDAAALGPDPPPNTDPGADPEARDPAAAEARVRALDLARAAYAELSAAARARQARMVDDAVAAMAGVLRDHAGADSDLRDAHASAIVVSDREAAGTVAGIDAAAALSLQQLDGTHRFASRALARAAGQVRGGIDARALEAMALITGRVATKCDLITKRFTTEKNALTTATDEAVKKLADWGKSLATSLPLADAASGLDAAKRERLHFRGPMLALTGAERIGKESAQQVTDWQPRVDEQVCKTRCSYTDALDDIASQTYDGGRASVDKAAGRARLQLQQMLDAARGQIERQRLAARAQVFLQQRSLQRQLLEQTEGERLQRRQQAQGSVAGMAAMARGAMPAYWQAPGHLRTALSTAAAASPAALEQAARSAPGPVLDGLDQASRLARERQQHEGSRLARQAGVAAAVLATRRDRQHAEGRQAMATAAAEAGAALTRIEDDFAGGAEPMPAAVRDAGQSFLVPPEKLLVPKFGKADTAADGAFTALFDGGEGGAAGAGTAAAGGAGGADGAACGDCGGAKGAGAGGGAGGEIKPIAVQRVALVDSFKQYLEPAARPDKLAPQIRRIEEEVPAAVKATILQAQSQLGGVFDHVNDAELTAALRSLTPGKARAVNEKGDLGVPKPGIPLIDEIASQYRLDDPQGYLEDRDFLACQSYLAGRAIDGAKWELKASLNWYNDQEGRVEATLRALPPSARMAIGEDPEIGAQVRDAMDGVDLQVVNALMDLGDQGSAEADALRARERVNAARSDGDRHKAVEELGKGLEIQEGDYRARELENMTPQQQEQAREAHRKAVVLNIGRQETEANAGLREQAAALAPGEARDRFHREQARAFATRGMTYLEYDRKPGTPAPRRRGPRSPRDPLVVERVALRDLAEALVVNGKDSVEAKAAQIGIEAERGENARLDNVLKAQHDSVLLEEPVRPDGKPLSPEEKADHDRRRQEALDRQAKIVALAAKRYASDARGIDGRQPDTAPGEPRQTDAQARLANLFARNLGPSDWSRRPEDTRTMTGGLFRPGPPSAKTASLLMQYALYAKAGTDEDLGKGMTSRMRRADIQAMEKQFKADTGRDLQREIGITGPAYGISEFGADDLIEMKKNWRGIATTEKQRIEDAYYAMRLQEDAPTWFGRGLASGSFGEQALKLNQQMLLTELGLSRDDFAENGDLKPGVADKLFNAEGSYIGPGDRGKLFAATDTAQQVGAAYSASIDRIANYATVTLAIGGALIGAIASGGAATPVIVAALASGLASMGANAAIKGGRYGWEQAGIDFAMTLVQAATAGLGAKLGAAAKVANLGKEAIAKAGPLLRFIANRFAGRPEWVQQVMIGAITGSFGSSANLIGGAATGALDDKAIQKGTGAVLASIFGGLARGVLSGASNAAVVQSLEALGKKGLAAKALAAVGGRVGLAPAGLVNRGAGALGKVVWKSTTGGVSGMASRGVELGYDRATGKERKDFGDALTDIGYTGLQSAAQGAMEGVGEQVGAARADRHRQTLEAAIKARRDEQALPALDGKALAKAADELVLMQQHFPGAAEAQLDHVARNGGLVPADPDGPGGGPKPPVADEADEAEATAAKPPAEAADEAPPSSKPPAAQDTDPTPAEQAALVPPVRLPGEGPDPRAGDGGPPSRPPPEAGAEATPMPRGATAEERAIAQDVRLLGMLGIGGDQGTPGRGRARSWIDRAVRVRRTLNRREHAQGRLTAANRMRERLREAWQRQAVFGPKGRRRLAVIGEIALGATPRMAALLGAPGPAHDAAARALLADYGEASRLLAMLDIADPQRTPNLAAAARALRDYRERIVAGLAADFGTSETWANNPRHGEQRRRGDAIELEIHDPRRGGTDDERKQRRAEGLARLDAASEQLAARFGPDWRDQLDIALVVRPDPKRRDPRPVDPTRKLHEPDRVYAPDAIRLPQEPRGPADAAAPAAAAVSSPAALPAAAGHTAPVVQKAILDTLAELRQITHGLSTVAPARALTMVERLAGRAIRQAADSDPLGPDFGGHVVGARLKEAWAKQALPGEAGLRRLAVIRELASPTSDRARALLGADADAAGAAALAILKDYGSYEHLMAMLSAGGPDLTPSLQACAERVLGFRAEVAKALNRGYGAYELGSASKFLNSDVDLSFDGSDAGARLLAAEARMEKAYGPDWEKLFTMNFYVGAERLTAFHDLTASERSAAAADALTDRTLEAVIGRVLSDVHDSEIGRAEVGRMAGLLGVDVSQPAARPDLDRGSYKDKRRAALLAVDQAVQALRAAPPADRAALRLEIAALTMVANRYSTEAYIGPGAVLLTLGASGRVTPDLALQSFVGDFENFIHKLYGHGRTVEGGLRDYTTFKYMGRMIEALRAGGVHDSRMRYFEGLAAYLYGGNREGGFASAHVFASPEIYASGKGKAQLADLPQDVGGTGAVGDAFLQADLARFMALIRDLAPQLRANTRAHFGPDRDTPPSPSPSPAAKPSADAEPSVIINLPGVITQAAPAAAGERPHGKRTADQIRAEKAAAVARVAELADRPMQAEPPAAKIPADPEAQAQAAADKARTLADEAQATAEAARYAQLAAGSGQRPTPPKPQGTVGDAGKRRYVIECFVALGLGLKAIAGALPHQFNGAFNALGDDSMRGSPAAQREAASWAMERAQGDLSRFAAFYEYAMQRHARLRPASGAEAAEALTAEGLQRSLTADLQRLATQPRAAALGRGTEAMSERDIGLAVQQLETFAFADSVREAYHALKHERELIEGFSAGDVFDRHLALAVDTIRTGQVIDTGSPPAGTQSTRIVIHKQYGDDPKHWREAILYVRPDGTVTLASWGSCKAVRRHEKTGALKGRGGKGGGGAADAGLGGRVAADQVQEASEAQKNSGKRAPQPKPSRPAAPQADEASAQRRKQDQRAKDDQSAKQDKQKARDRKKP